MLNYITSLLCIQQYPSVILKFDVHQSEPKVTGSILGASQFLKLLRKEGSWVAKCSTRVITQNEQLTHKTRNKMEEIIWRTEWKTGDSNLTISNPPSLAPAHSVLISVSV